MQLGTKAETLHILEHNLKGAKVLPQYTFTVGQWRKNKTEILYNFQRLTWKNKVIVRSSSLQEDTEQQSQAGKYKSIGNVSGEGEFIKAVEAVIRSYGEENSLNQVLVQPMLENVDICGVAFTLEPGTLGHYFVINYDETGSTSAVTSGLKGENCLYYQFKDSVYGEKYLPDFRMQRLCDILNQLESIFELEYLDVEFAFTNDDTLYILQVRPLCITGKPIDKKRQKEELVRIIEKIESNDQKKPFLCGDSTVYSVMTDWNPAEMIGVRPKPLAISLYREIITDSVWAYQRDNYGYRNLRSFPLMVDFAGLPYIDVRVSFNSFIPSELEQTLSEKLINYYLSQLREHPEKHDKAEFDIVYSCYTLDLPEKIQVLKKFGFSEPEIEQIVNALRNVTNRITDYKNGLWRKDYKKIGILNQRYQEIMRSDISDVEKVYWLLEDCKRYGTLPFAGLARAAFIAVQMLQSFVWCGILSEDDYEAFMNEVETISSTMNRDYEKLSKASFLEKYGHLRPGTYDITSLRYDEAPELYFDGVEGIQYDQSGGEGYNYAQCSTAKSKVQKKFRLSLQQLNMLRNTLQENGLSNDVLDIMEFMKSVIEGREYGKFIFTRNLSMAIHLIGQIGMKYDISREDCAYIDIRTIYELYISTENVKNKFLSSIRQGKEKYEVTQTITLPPVIADANDVILFYYPNTEPNYITSLKVCGEIKVINSTEDVADIAGKVVMIQSADPGYDWIFLHGIKGFITMYGGANSHMAIRAGELRIPAVIGIGAKQYEQYEAAKIVEIDALQKTIKILK